MAETNEDVGDNNLGADLGSILDATTSDADASVAPQQDSLDSLINSAHSSAEAESEPDNTATSDADSDDANDSDDASSASSSSSDSAESSEEPERNTTHDSSASSSEPSASTTSAEPADSSSDSSSEASSSATSTSASPSSASGDDTDDSSADKAIKTQHDKAFHKSMDDAYDADPLWYVGEARHDIRQYVDLARKDYRQKPNEETFDSHLNKLLDAQNKMYKAFNSFLLMYHHNVGKLKQQADALDAEVNEMDKFNPQQQLNVLIRMAKTGMPAKMEELFRQFSWVANEPRFKTWLHNTGYDDKKHQLSAPSIIKQKQAKLEQAHKARLNALAKAKEKKSKKGGK